MESADQQILFFQHLKDKIPAHLSFVDEISQVLHISEDSAYRRIRGSKTIDFEEIRELCLHFKVSLDQHLNLSTHNMIFTGRFIKTGDFNFKAYLETMLAQFR